MHARLHKDLQFYKFCLYGFLKNLKFFDPFLLLFFRSHGLTYFQIGWLYAVREAATNLLEIPSGLIADVWGRRRAMILAFLCYILSFLIFYLSGSFVPFLLASLLFACGEAFRSGTHKAMIFDYLRRRGWESQKLRYYGATRACAQFGSAVASLLAAGIVLWNKDYQAIFLGTMIPYLLGLLLITSYPRELDNVSTSGKQRSFLLNLRHILLVFLSTLRNRKVALLSLNLSLHSGLYKALKDYLQLVVKTFALTFPLTFFPDSYRQSALFVGTTYFLLYLFTSGSSASSNLFSSRFRSLPRFLNVTLLAGILLPLFLGIFFRWGFFPISIGLLLLFLSLENLRKPAGLALLAETVQTDVLASALSATNQIKTLIAALLSPAIGYLADKVGVGIAIATVSFALLLISPFLFVREEK